MFSKNKVTPSRNLVQEVDDNLKDFLYGSKTKFGSNGFGLEDEDKSINQTKRNKSGNNNYDYQESKDFDEGSYMDDGKEIYFAHESYDPQATQTISNLKQQFKILSDQINEFKSKLEQHNEKLESNETAKNQLEDKIFSLEEENSVIQQKLLETVNNQNNRRKSIFGPNLTTVNKKRFHDDNKTNIDINRALRSFEDADIVISYDEIFQQQNIWLIIKYWYLKHLPFQSDIHKIEAKLGSSVASYFLFQRFLFMQFTFLLLVTYTFALYHVAHVISRGDYELFYTSDGLQPNFLMFSSFHTNESLFYSWCVVCTMLVICITSVHKLVSEDRKRKEYDAYETENSYPTAKEVFCCWDFSLTTQQDSNDLNNSLEQFFQQFIDESQMKLIQSLRTPFQKNMLLARRVYGFCLSICVQGCAFLIIIYLSINQTPISLYVKGIPFLSHISSFVAPVSLNLLNKLIPSILGSITQFEQWDFGTTEVNLLLFRMFTSDLLNILLLVFSYMLLANPLLLANYNSIRSALQVIYSTSFQCRLDQAANGLFVILITSSTVQIVGKFSFSVVKILLNKYFNANLKKKEFDVADELVSLLDLMAAQFLLFPFSPLSIVLLPLILAFKIKFETYFMLLLFNKPKRPWKSQKAGSVYITFYVITIFVTAFPSCVLLLISKTFQKSCAIQDEYIGLCVDDPIEKNGIYQCTTKTSSDYYNAYGQTTYPNSICSNACGAFVNYESATKPIVSSIESVGFFYGIYESLFIYPYLSWGIVVILAILAALMSNTLRVSHSSHINVEKVLETKVLTLEAENMKQAKIIARLKANTDPQPIKGNVIGADTYTLPPIPPPPPAV